MLILANIRLLLAKSYEKYPKMTNGCSGAGVFGGGDVMAQILEQGGSEIGLKSDQYNIDRVRSARVAALGFFVSGFVLYHWYSLMDKYIGTSMQNNAIVFKKMVADQVIYAPLSISVYFASTTVDVKADAGQNLTAFEKKMKSSFLTTYMADFAMWPAVNFLNFRYIPLNFRPTFVGAAQLTWQTYMSWVAHGPDSAH